MGRQSKMRVCKNCGNSLPDKEIICPSCGAKNKKPVYKRWWFWVIVVCFIMVQLQAVVQSLIL